MIHLRPICPGCEEETVQVPGQYCLDCADVLSASGLFNIWPNDNDEPEEPYVPDPADVARDRDEEERCRDL